jgi:hypothetical protein
VESHRLPVSSESLDHEPPIKVCSVVSEQIAEQQPSLTSTLENQFTNEFPASVTPSVVPEKTSKHPEESRSADERPAFPEPASEQVDQSSPHETVSLTVSTSEPPLSCEVADHPPESKTTSVICEPEIEQSPLIPPTHECSSKTDDVLEKAPSNERVDQSSQFPEPDLVPEFQPQQVQPVSLSSPEVYLLQSQDVSSDNGMNYFHHRGKHSCQAEIAPVSFKQSHSVRIQVRLFPMSSLSAQHQFRLFHSPKINQEKRILRELSLQRIGNKAVVTQTNQSQKL